MEGNQIADIRVEMAACRVDKEGRLSGLEIWKQQQNGELKLIRRKGTATLVAIILLLIGVVANLAVDQSAPAANIEEVVQEAIEVQLTPIIEAVVIQVLRTNAAP